LDVHGYFHAEFSRRPGEENPAAWKKPSSPSIPALLLVIDGARWHISADIEAPEGSGLHVLQAYFPEI
jgi:hypothetical protein